MSTAWTLLFAEVITRFRSYTKLLLNLAHRRRNALYSDFQTKKTTIWSLHNEY